MEPGTVILVALGGAAGCCVALIVAAFRECRLAQIRYEITDGATELQEHMLSGELRDGELCHDFLYQTVFLSQYVPRFVPVSVALGQFRTAGAARRQQLVEELASKSAECRAVFGRVFLAYMRGMFYENPLLALIFSCRVLFASVRETQRQAMKERAAAEVSCYALTMSEGPVLAAT